jgi:hypothetical protein
VRLSAADSSETVHSTRFFSAGSAIRLESLAAKGESLFQMDDRPGQARAARRLARA